MLGQDGAVSKPLSLNEIRTRAAQFVIDWRDSPGDERQDAQSFVRDLLSVYGIADTRAALYEKRAQRTSTGGQGYIDALVPGQLLIEMKSAGRQLGLAEIQALDYMDDLPDVEQPRYVLTSDFKRFRLLDVTAPKGEDVTEWSLEELPRYAGSLAFLAGYQTRSFGSKEQERASVKAAQLMAELYEALEGSGLDDHDAGVFLVRTLFSLYADDSGVWPRDLFLEFIETRTSADGSDLGAQLVGLYQVMNQPQARRSAQLDEMLAQFPYVNGGIFAGSIDIPYFAKQVRELLLRCCAFDWREISPAIFGSLFQAVKSPEARRSLGEHYTTETNILKTLAPLFLDELHGKFEAARHDAAGLKKLRAELAEIRVLDPACGSGNFLIVAYRELRQLELDILIRLQELGDTSAIPALYFERDHLAVKLTNIAGLEIEEWPVQIARTALRLVDHQANMAMEARIGKAPDTLPLDSVMVVHQGNALRTDWSEILPPQPGVMVVGNPPFIGQYTKTTDQTEDLKQVWGKQYDGYLDYVTGWFKKAADYLAETPGSRFAFVSTNSIAQGQPAPSLFKPLFEAGWRIRFAHQTFAWTSEASGAAAVHCVITGFDRGTLPEPVLFRYSTPKSEPIPTQARSINAYLIDGVNLYVEKRMKPLSPMLAEITRGSQATDGGHLLVSKEQYPYVSIDPIAKPYLRPYIGARELLHGEPRWCLWLEDFDPADLNRSPVLRERVSACLTFRESGATTGDAYKLRNTPHLFRPNLKRPKGSFVGIPRHVSETRLFFPVMRFHSNTIAGDANFTVEDVDGFQFAVMSSSMFITWQKAVGGRLKSDLRFSSTLVWNNLPLPPIDDSLHQQIIDAGQRVLDARALHPERSLADHYNPLAMAPELLKAHAALDRVVDKAFGASSPLRSNEERLQMLFERYAELTKLGE